MTSFPHHATCLPADFRRTMGQFPTGVALLTSGDVVQGHAMTVNSFTSVSLTPPMVLVCVTPSSRITSCIAVSGCFGISVLAAPQDGLASYFADRRRLPGLPSTPDTHFRAGPALGVPLLEEATGHLECSVATAIDAGDHVVYLAHVAAAAWRGPVDPLVFFNGSFTSVGSADRRQDRAPAVDTAR